MPREFGPETLDTTPQTSFDAGIEVDDHFVDSEFGADRTGQNLDSTPEYPSAEDANPDDRYTSS